MRMTSVRLSAIFLALFAIFAIVLVVYVTATASGILQQQSRVVISDEIRELGGVYGRSGIVGLVRSIDQRARQPGASLYLVTDATGRILAGNVQSLDFGVIDKSGYISKPFGYERFAEDPADRYHEAVAEVIALPNGMRVLVGRDVTDQDRIRQVVRDALVLALGLMGAGALFAWLLVGRRALHRLDLMSRSSRRILAGDLSERLPVTGAGDEFDRLSENMNTLLARVSLLQEGLRQVSDNIAHDLKTPLTRLRNRAEAALADHSEGADPRAALEGAMAEADQMIRTFDALLMISRVEAGSHPVEKTMVDLTQIASDVVELYEPVAEDAGATIVLGAPEPVRALVSRELIAQTFSNLIDNALKHGSAELDNARVQVTVEKDGGLCRLAVSDNGPGIPVEERERVLERFYRLDKSRTLPGSGLGLSLVQAIARLHGGRLLVEDAQPGLKIVLEFPDGVEASANEQESGFG
ncbi:HAMP domain-containing protein [Aureimonas fodinaquatilis]|uniref:histidine kinase n=1 Tax=Aureimonas fodinaquatilis TaxID=2565783 RepID=A0A5B0DWU0_9HYPH|nr:ATP-binding protein [Aureimonas fodinaquatilis]KAA0971287.1 HAMP domain-containing protein [Aureimonas fodinaquatilis]